MKQGFIKILEEYNSLTEQMSSGADFDMAKVGKRQSELLPTVEKIQHLQECEKQIEENKQILDSDDEEMRAMAVEDIEMLESKIIELTDSIETDLIPKDPNDEKNAIIEMRAGAGGDESTGWTILGHQCQH